MNTLLTALVEHYRKDFRNETGKDFSNFFCPILQRDEPGELCEGHIINKAFRLSNQSVPQLSAVDSFFGSRVEADFIAALKGLELDPAELLFDADLRRSLRPSLELNGEQIQHYIKPRNHPKIEGHQTFDAVFNGIQKGSIVLKMTPEQQRVIGKGGLSVVVEADVQPHAIVTSMKAAHLTLFKLLRYRYALSPGGSYFAAPLGSFFDRYNKMEKAEVSSHLGKHFYEYANSVMPIVIAEESAFQGTAIDNTLFFVEGTKSIFAIGVIVPADRDKFCVFVPGDPLGFETYLSFIKTPPPSIEVRVAKFISHRDANGPRWEVSEAKFRIPMPDTVTLPEWAKAKLRTPRDAATIDVSLSPYRRAK